MVLLLSTIVPGFSIVTHLNIASHAPADEVLQVWFDGPPSLTILYPIAYEFNVAAVTSSEFWITSLHWDFGDGSTLDVPFSGVNHVSDSQFHAYTLSGLHTVTVTAYDNAGNSESAHVTVNWTIPAQNCQNSLNRVDVHVTPSSSIVQVGQSVTFTASPAGGAGSYSYVWAWHQEGKENTQHGTGTGDSYTFKPTSTGTYEVSLTATDSCGILIVKLTVHSILPQ
jgi:PKD repeat protein